MGKIKENSGRVEREDNEHQGDRSTLNSRTVRSGTPLV